MKKSYDAKIYTHDIPIKKFPMIPLYPVMFRVKFYMVIYVIYPIVAIGLAEKKYIYIYYTQSQWSIIIVAGGMITVSMGIPYLQNLQTNPIYILGVN